VASARSPFAGICRSTRLPGYVHPEYMSVVFKRSTGQTPGEYRRSVVVKDAKYLKKDTHVLNHILESI
jgi:transcriptional regulator GlxA family with amidase domain